MAGEGGRGYASIEPGGAWEDRCVQLFNSKVRDELLDAEVFDAMLEAKVLVVRWRKHRNLARPDSSLGHRPPAPNPPGTEASYGDEG